MPEQRCLHFVVFSWILVFLWAGVIFFMSSNTGDDLTSGKGIVSMLHEQLDVLQKKVFGTGIDIVSPAAHFCEYVAFGALLANALRCRLPLRRACVIAILCASCYGISDEIHQLFIPDRTCDPLDWLVDTLGGILGSFCFGRLVSRRRTKHLSDSF